MFLAVQVPTIYEAANGETTWTNQFSYTERFRPLATHLGGHAAKDEDHNKHGSARHMPAQTSVSHARQSLRRC